MTSTRALLIVVNSFIRLRVLEDSIKVNIFYMQGTVPRLSRVVLDVAITFTLYDYISKAMAVAWPVKH